MPVLTRSIAALATGAPGGPIIVVRNPQDEALYADAVEGLPPDVRRRILPPVAGGSTRQASVLAGLDGLAALTHPPALVLVHDAARPFVSPDVIARVTEAASRDGAAVPGVAVADTIKSIDAEGRVSGTPDRAVLRAIQTPQAFRFAPLLEAHRRARDAAVTG